MSYDLSELFRVVQASLWLNPRVTLYSLARQLGVERHTIERATRAVTGKSYRGYQQQALFERACKMLSGDPLRSIKEVAFNLRFSSPRSFARFVRRMSGLSPSEIRRKLAANAKTVPHSSKRSGVPR